MQVSVLSLTDESQSGLEIDILVFQIQQFVYANYVGPVSLHLLNYAGRCS